MTPITDFAEAHLGELKTRGEIASSIDRVNAQIDSLEQAAHMLGNELQPILRLDGPERADTSNPDSTTGVELADRLQHFADRIQAIDGVLRRLVERTAL